MSSEILQTTLNALQSGSTPTQQTRNWDEVLILQELKGLAREQKHLSSKSQERPLNTWESSRMGEIVEEILDLLTRISKFRSRTSV